MAAASSSLALRIRIRRDLGGEGGRGGAATDGVDGDDDDGRGGGGRRRGASPVIALFPVPLVLGRGLPSRQARAVVACVLAPPSSPSAPRESERAIQRERFGELVFYSSKFFFFFFFASLFALNFPSMTDLFFVLSSF